MTTEPNSVRTFRSLAAEQGIATTTAEPMNPNGFWWIDGADAHSGLSVDWKDDRGFGIYPPDAGFGERPGRLVEDPAEALRAALEAGVQTA